MRLAVRGTQVPPRDGSPNGQPRSLERHIPKELWHTPVDQIEAPELLDAIAKVTSIGYPVGVSLDDFDASLPRGLKEQEMRDCRNSSGRNDMNALRAALQEIQIGSPMAVGPLAMFPLLKSESTVASYRLLDDALDAGFASVTETSTSGSVPELLFRNISDDDILLVDGEELVGAKQNRVLNLTILVGARQEVKIPVSCVEAGRWAWRSQFFAAGRRGLHASARIAKMGGVSASLREGGVRARHDIQSAVWRSIGEKMLALNSPSETAALHDVYCTSEVRLREIRNRFKAQTGQVGAAFAMRGRIIGIEMFDAAKTFASLLPKLVDSYAFDAIEISSDAPTADLPGCDEVKEILQRIASAQGAEYPAVGKGRDLRIDGDRLSAAALLVQGRVVHLSVFDQRGE